MRIIYFDSLIDASDLKRLTVIAAEAEIPLYFIETPLAGVGEE